MGYQKRIAAAAVALGTALTTILNHPEGDFDVPEVIKQFSHAGKIDGRSPPTTNGSQNCGYRTGRHQTRQKRPQRE